MEAPSPKLRFPAFKEGWKEARLAKFFRSSRAKGEEGMPTLSVTLSRGLVNRSEIERKTETNLGAHEHLLVRESDIAYNMMRMWQGAFGRSDRDGIVSPAYVVLSPQTTADSGYFEYAFRRARSIYLFWAYSYGITNDRLRLYANDFLRIPFSAPSLPEQRKIAEFLTAVDGRIGQLSQKKALLEDYKKGVMQQLFTQALRFKDDHGNDFPEWKETPLRSLCSLITKGTTPTSLGHSYQTTGINFIKTENITKTGFIDIDGTPKISEACHKELQRSALEVGDVLFSIAGTLGRTAIVQGHDLPANTNQALGIIRLKDADTRIFITQSLNKAEMKNWIRRMVSVGAQPNLSLQQLGEIQIALPSQAEQTKIANFLTALDRKIESVSQQITHTQTFKKGLLQQMFV